VGGRNIGWINLNDATIFVGDCPADYNGDGVLSVSDIFDFLAGWFAGDPRADFNGAGEGVSDIFDFLAAWFCRVLTGAARHCGGIRPPGPRPNPSEAQMRPHPSI